LSVEPRPGDTAIRPAASGLLAADTVLAGRYRIRELLASGGMGEVYRAEHVELGRAFALKVMKPELAGDADFVDRFRKEAVACSRIGHPNIIDIVDFGRTPDGLFYFAMELLDGRTLAELVAAEGAQSVKRVRQLMAQLCHGLAAAHALGIVHRDLKPENVMLIRREGLPDVIKILDFGIAKVTGSLASGGQTAIGLVVGTPQYMSPEQAEGKPIDARTDIYSVGLILYELLTGRPAFEGSTPSLLIAKQVAEPPPPMVEGPIEPIPPAL
jgi:serine/threonine-protein kinase